MSANQTSAGQPTDTAGMHEVLGAVKATLGTMCVSSASTIDDSDNITDHRECILQRAAVPHDP